MPARTTLQAQVERYEGHREPLGTCAIGFVAHLTPMDLGQTPSAQNLANMQSLEKWMRDSRPHMAQPMDMDLNDWPPDLSEQPPPPSSGGGSL